MRKTDEQITAEVLELLNKYMTEEEYINKRNQLLREGKYTEIEDLDDYYQENKI